MPPKGTGSSHKKCITAPSKSTDDPLLDVAALKFYESFEEPFSLSIPVVLLWHAHLVQHWGLQLMNYNNTNYYYWRVILKNVPECQWHMNCTRNNLVKCVVQSKVVIQVCFMVSFGCWIAPLNQVLNRLLWTAYWSLSLIPGSCDVYILLSRFVCIPHLFNHTCPQILKQH